MIKIKGLLPSGKVVLMLGLSERNIELLKSNRPIFVEGGSVQIPDMEVFIFYGKDEIALIAEIEKITGNVVSISV